jgi:hypothetical protein
LFQLLFVLLNKFLILRELTNQREGRGAISTTLQLHQGVVTVWNSHPHR